MASGSKPTLAYHHFLLFTADVGTVNCCLIFFLAQWAMVSLQLTHSATEKEEDKDD